MLKNLYNGFVTVLKDGAIDIDQRIVLNIHSMLAKELGTGSR